MPAAWIALTARLGRSWQSTGVVLGQHDGMAGAGGVVAEDLLGQRGRVELDVAGQEAFARGLLANADPLADLGP